MPCLFVCLFVPYILFSTACYQVLIISTLFYFIITLHHQRPMTCGTSVWQMDSAIKMLVATKLGSHFPRRCVQMVGGGCGSFGGSSSSSSSSSGSCCCCGSSSSHVFL